MNRRHADLGVGLLVGGILVVGGALSWDAYQQQQGVEQMGSMMGSVHGTDPLVYVLGTLFAAGVVGVLYLAVRPQIPSVTGEANQSGSADRHGASDQTTPSDQTTHSNGGVDFETRSRQRVLDLLPEDERRILQPVLTSPGLTQIELRDRADFSKSKVSQTVSELEKRGLLYRERQGRTYRVYPSDELESNGAAAQQQSSSGDH